MLIINFANIENLIFYDSNLRKKLPEFNAFFDQWRLSLLASNLKTLKNQALINCLKNIKEPQIDILKTYFNDEITIDNNIDYRSVIHLEDDPEKIESLLNEYNFNGNLVISKSKDHVQVTIWR